MELLRTRVRFGSTFIHPTPIPSYLALTFSRTFPIPKEAAHYPQGRNLNYTTMRLVTVALALGPVVTAAKLDDDAGSAQTPFSYEEQEDVEAADAGWGSEGPLTRDFRQKVNHWLGEWHVPGLAVGVVDGDETWTKVS